MPTFDIEGLGATVAFATNSAFNGNVIDITAASPQRESLETTHLGTTGAKTNKPGKLQNSGTYELTFDHNPNDIDMLTKDPEVVTISYPLRTGQTTPDRRVFTAWVSNFGGEEFKPDTLMRSKCTLTVTGVIQKIAGS